MRQRPFGLGVHEHHVRPEIAHHRGHLGIGAKGGGIVDHARAEFEAAPGDGGFVRVHRDERMRREIFNYRLDTPQLFSTAHRLRSGAGGLAADVD